MRRTLLAILSLLFAACSDGGSDREIAPPPILVEGEFAITLVLPSDAGPGLRAAGEDFLALLGEVVGTEAVGVPEYSDELDVPPGTVVRISLLQTETALFGDEGYRISSGELDGKHIGILVEAATQQGAIYGLYDILADQGLRFLHPEETFVPVDPAATLAWAYTGTLRVPDFRLRGFHEHTQHPTVMSDFLLRTDDPTFPDYLSRYLRWMVRNRQNVLTFHLLKTVDLEKWLPYIGDVREEAARFGIRVGPFLSFSDQQQNCFKLVDEGAVDDDGNPVPEAAQITEGIDRLMEAGFDVIGFQVGSSEFTKPGDDVVVERLNTAVAHLRDHYPDVEPFAWIHITCSLETDNGGYFYHLPLDADLDLGAFVHTTMFYTLTDPAPVYECEDFSHQLDFMTKADGKRTQVFFPETAWWLGFDNNLPLALPITGWSRQYDVQEVLPAHDIDGHVTFTTGREWGYWQYDHYLTRLTWDRDRTWEDYLAWVAPAYGAAGEAVSGLLADWTDLQRKHFYEENPLILFYLSGELKQDEVGAQAGVLARRPKVAYKTVLEMDADAFAEWQETDFDMLVRMRAEYGALYDAADLPDVDGEPAQRLVRETSRVLDIYLRRIDHTIALYSGVSAARAWRLEQLRAAAAEPTEEPDVAIREQAKAEAYAKLAAARVISAGAVQLLQAAESDYRYPVELLAREKPESLTAYPYGYLWQTSTGHFWTRRDDQLEGFLGQLFDESVEAWETEPDTVFAAGGESVTITVPDDAIAAAAISGFIPRLLFGLVGFDGTGTPMVLVAPDANGNDLPDPETVTAIAGEIAAGTWAGTTESLVLPVYDSASESLGTLILWDTTLSLDPGDGAPDTGEVAAEVESAALISLIMSVGGIDEEGAGNLVKGVYDLPPEEPLPERLPIAFTVVPEPLS